MMAEEPGEDYVKMSQSVTVKNGKTSTISVGRIGYDATVLFNPLQAANVTAGNTATYSDLLTDGTHFWLTTATTITNCAYNGVAVAWTKSGNYWMITIPNNYDPTIPFIFT
ncbi:MAG: hypothetical protein J6Y20_08990 [Lachnospiraceae bacterium]|nr:hypothetical protein [Lachnospiraceae bacterium]